MGNKQEKMIICCFVFQPHGKKLQNCRMTFVRCALKRFIEHIKGPKTFPSISTYYPRILYM